MLATEAKKINHEVWEEVKGRCINKAKESLKALFDIIEKEAKRGKNYLVINKPQMNCVKAGILRHEYGYDVVSLRDEKNTIVAFKIKW